MMDLTPSQCAVVLVHYNNPVDTLVCLRALSNLTVPPAYIVVVDNGSPIEAAQIIFQDWEALCYNLELEQPHRINGSSQCLPSTTDTLNQHIFLALSKNTGFSGGNNAALRLLLTYTNCKAFWLLNNDTEPMPCALDALCTRLNQKAEAGLCGSTLVYTHIPEQLQCAGGSTLSPLTGQTRFLHEYVLVKNILEYNTHDTEQAMDYITGASLLIRREVFKKIGVLPEEYFLYYEDAAFCLAAKKAGFSLAWAQQSIVYHNEGGSSGAKSSGPMHKPQRSRFVDYLSLRNRVFLMRIYYPWAIPIVGLSYLGVIINRLRRSEADRISLICKAFWNGLWGKMGNIRSDI